jgi:hypothetical protein
MFRIPISFDIWQESLFKTIIRVNILNSTNKYHKIYNMGVLTHVENGDKLFENRHLTQRM